MKTLCSARLSSPHRFLVLLLTTCYLLPTTYSTADEPSVSYIFPAGGQRGSTVNFHVGGHYLHDRCPFEMIGAGVDASKELVRAAEKTWFEGPVIPMPASQRKENYPWPQTGSVSIASDAPLGFCRWRVWTSQGVTESMKFVIGDLPEIVEEEINGDPIPTEVKLPVTINGRMFPREDVDIWTFEAEAGASYTCEVMANRLGSPLDTRLIVYGPDEQRIAENVDGRGVDSFLRFVAPEDGRYEVHIHDVNFGGLQDYVYRLTITDGPRVDDVYPLGGRRGTTADYSLKGQHVPAEPVSLTLPMQEDSLLRKSLSIGGQTTNRFSLELSDLPEFLEAEPNDDAEYAKSFETGSVLNGRIDKAGDVDNWWFSATKGQKINFDLRAARLGSPLDSVLTIFDETGKEIASNDDVRKGQTDSGLKFRVPADGRYRLVVREQFRSRGGSSFAYRLYATAAKEPRPDFAIQLAADAATLPRTGQVKLKVVATRQDGFQGAITLEAKGLPQGVTLVNNTIKTKKNDTQLTFKADESAKIGVAKIQLVGKATIGETEVSRIATKPANSPDDIELDHLTLAVAFPTPFKVVGEFETRYAARGSTYHRHYTIDRGGYEGPITVRMAERQVRHLQGVTGGTVLVPSGETEFDYAIKLPPWMQVGRTSRTCVMAVADVKDSDGEIHRVSYTSQAQNDQVIVLVDPGQLAVRLEEQSITAAPGGERSLNVTVGRGQAISGPIEVQLIVPDHIQGVSSKPIVIESGDKSGTLGLVFDKKSLGPWNMPLTVRVTAMQNGDPYTAETQLSVVSDRDKTPPLRDPVAEAQ